MIKKTLLGLSITLLGLINFLNAGFTQQIGSTYDSNINSNFKIKFLNGGAFESSYLGLSKNILALRDNVVVWRTKNGFPYFYLESSNVPYFGVEQGFPDRYYLCDEIAVGQINTPGNCTESNIWNYSGNNENIKSELKQFFSKVKQNDYVYYNLVDFNREVYLQLCWNSSDLGKSLCFKVGKDNGYISGNVVYHVVNPLINSQNLNDDFGFAMVPTDRIGYAPGQAGYGGGGTYINTITTNYTCPTIRQLMQNMGKNYNTGLCYNNTNYYNGTNFEQIEKEDIFTIFNDNYENYVNRISIYRNNCNAPATSQNCGNAFSGEFKKFSIISNAINSKVDEKNLWNYCNLGLNFDPNATTCTLNGTGIIKEEYTTEEEIQNIINNGTIPTPGNNTGENEDSVINILNDCEDGNRQCYINNRNFIDSLSSIYGKITGLFKERNGVEGIIPEYILRITFMMILFTVIFKK